MKTTQKVLSLFLLLVFVLGMSFGSATEAQAKSKKSKKSKGLINVTIDDCRSSAWDFFQQVSVNKKYKKIKFTFFCIPSRIGTGGYLTWEQVTQIYKAKNCEIGNHTLDHKDLTKLTEAKKKEQIMDAQDAFEKHGIHRVNDIAYPLGESDQSTRDLARSLGFDTGRQAWIEDKDDPYDHIGNFDRMWLKAMGVKKNTSAASVCSMIKGTEKNGDGLSLVLHTFGNDDDNDTVTMGQATGILDCMNKEIKKNRLSSVAPSEMVRALTPKAKKK